MVSKKSSFVDMFQEGYSDCYAYTSTVFVCWQIAAVGIAIDTLTNWKIDPAFPVTSLQRNVFFFVQLLPSAIGLFAGTLIAFYYIGMCLFACPGFCGSCCRSCMGQLRTNVENSKNVASAERQKANNIKMDKGESYQQMPTNETTEI